MSSGTKKILFVVEGANTENNNVGDYAESLLSLTEREYEISVYGTTIYDLYQKMIVEGSYSDVVSFLKDQGKLALEPGIRSDEAFNSIYLVFDYDPQDPRMTFDHLIQCAQFFSDETRKGKLYINFPMFESFWDVVEKDGTWALSESEPREGLNGDRYKGEVRSRSVFGSTLPILGKENLVHVIRLNEERYRSMLSIGAKACWPGTNIPSLVRVQKRNEEDSGLIRILNTFCLLVLDYNPDLI